MPQDPPGEQAAASCHCKAWCRHHARLMKVARRTRNTTASSSANSKCSLRSVISIRCFSSVRRIRTSLLSRRLRISCFSRGRTPVTSHPKCSCNSHGSLNDFTELA